MKKIYLMLLPFLAAACSSQGGQQTAVQIDAPVNVMTFNVRYDNPNDSLNNWNYRKDRVANAIRFYDADIVGTQEVLHNQMEDLRQRLPGYESIGVGREDGKEVGEYSALWYRKDRFTEKESGWFWLSETPEVVGSKGWDGACERIATWAKLQDRLTGKELFVMNTHLDHVGVAARREGVKLLLDKIQELGGSHPVILTGDFNAEPESNVIRQVTDTTNPEHLTDARTVADLVYGPNWTFHDFGSIPYGHRERIDYIFVKNGLEVLKYGILAETEGDAYLSDHAPVLVSVK
ncbi:endonuclease/exonuclease/phosphatase family protein [Bacteroides sp. ET225]|uniref:Endonuclease/exonuclease/phosphatase family protein n=1 Tax=Candidatus Phocaeicola excrementipullorum TaxID=2838731 RepID=A0A948TKX7_9BACT|nr:endonuclease/exonuclease/phosphatase family protein [Bacteroides sp. ET225]MBU3855347.1 endonuclease/exonuclease/phosphatase family protein [Candidatus Phocaeicola excrementipullorum]MCR8919045.1 endonuclease/exonuclease/phosphatase family protein [Bacteroides sp. ET225]